MRVLFAHLQFAIRELAVLRLSSRIARRYWNWKSEEFTLANTASAQKEIRKNARRRVRNRLVRAKTRTVSKRAVHAIEAGDANAADQVRIAQRELDAAAQKGIIHRNAASRHKSRLMKRLNAETAPE